MTPPWSLAGTYFEACNCAVACPCVFLSAPTTGECTLLIGWHIDQGHFGELRLDGLNIVLAVYAPGHMAQGNWKAALYLDERASQTHREALLQIFSGKAGGHPEALAFLVDEILGVQNVTIIYQAKGKQRRLQIPAIAEVEIEALAGQEGAEVTIHNPPLCIAPGYPLVVATSQQFNYHDHGLQWEISGKNGFYSAFTYQGP